MSGIVYVYGLVNPQTEKVFYVGSTVQPHVRLNYHCSGWSGGQVSQVAKELSDSGTRPTMKILEETDRFSRFDKERQWIAKLSEEGHSLVNMISPPNSR